MDNDEFRICGGQMIDYICNYFETIKDRRVTPSIEPGYLQKLLPDEAPEEPESFNEIMSDVATKIMPGLTHWQHPHFHAYTPNLTSYTSILGDMLIDTFGCIGFSWAAGPASTELETIVLDWMGKAIGLPEEFLWFTEGGNGGGICQTSSSESVLIAMLAARTQAIKRLKQLHPNIEQGLLLSKLIAYCSTGAHSCVEKGAKIAMVKLRILEPDTNGRLRVDTLIKSMEHDEEEDLVPFFVLTTLGTTNSYAFDNLEEIGIALEEFPDVWLHVDAAYAGSVSSCIHLPGVETIVKGHFSCPTTVGIEYAQSFSVNANKLLPIAGDCSILYVRDRDSLVLALTVNPLYLQHDYSDEGIDFRNFMIPLTRRFRSLKLWFVLRNYGLLGLQECIRNHIKLAKRFESHVLADKRFEVCNEVRLGLVCFRLRGTDGLNEKLLSLINVSGNLHMVPAMFNKRIVIRFIVCTERSLKEDIDTAWSIIQHFATELIEKKREVADLLNQMEEDKLTSLCPLLLKMVNDTKLCNCAIHEAGLQTPTGNLSLPWIMPLSFLFRQNDDDSEGTIFRI